MWNSKSLKRNIIFFKNLPPRVLSLKRIEMSSKSRQIKKGNTEWQRLNHRRVTLINKKYMTGLNDVEILELQSLEEHVSKLLAE